MLPGSVGGTSPESWKKEEGYLVLQGPQASRAAIQLITS